MKIPVLGIPHYIRKDLLNRCVQSIDVEVENLVVVLNNERQTRVAGGFNAHRIIYIEHPNAGVAASWNEIIKLFPAPYWMLVNDDIEFSPGDLEKMVQFIQEQPGIGACYGNHGASWWVVTSAGIQTVGLFDENIYPAYLEDCDWARRADLLGVQRPTVPGVNALHGDGRLTGSCTVNASRELATKNSRTHQGNFEYYQRKWGGPNEKEVFTRPFNDPNWPVWAWQFEPETRAKQQW